MPKEKTWPDHGDHYWAVTGLLRIIYLEFSTYKDAEDHQLRKGLGNCFKTAMEANSARERLIKALNSKK